MLRILQEVEMAPLRTWSMLVAVLSLAASVEAAKKIKCGSGDAACLVAAVEDANASTREVVIQLAAGVYTLDPTNAPALVPVGLQNTGRVTIRGAGADVTIIERAADAPAFRIVTNLGTLTLEKVTIRGGDGGGVSNASNATLTVIDSRITLNRAQAGGGLSGGGTVTVLRSSISDNRAQDGAGIVWGGKSLLITDSAITGNIAQAFGGGIYKAFSGNITIVNSTIAGNSAPFGGAIQLGVPDFPTSGPTGLVTITNSTLAGNRASVGGGGLSGAPFASPNHAAATLASTIVADNVRISGPNDCAAVDITSAGNNLIENSACAGALLERDLTGDPLLGALVDDGTPGHAYFPLLEGSPAIDAGGEAPKGHGGPAGKAARQHKHDDADADCPAEDQIGQRRIGPCDIGAIEFQPPVDVVNVTNAIYLRGARILYVSASSSAAPEVRLLLTVPGCLKDVRMQNVGNAYFLLDQVRGCGNLDGREATIRSSGGGEATAIIE
jgi:Right handed beta helix region